MTYSVKVVEKIIGEVRAYSDDVQSDELVDVIEHFRESFHGRPVVIVVEWNDI